MPDFGVAEDPTRRFIIGIDYGTTFTSVSYCTYSSEDEKRYIEASEIEVVKRWPWDGFDGQRSQVPTESWYPIIPRHSRPLADIISDAEVTSSHVEDSETNLMDPNHWTSLGASGQEADEEDMDDDESSPRFLWGYEVPYQRYVGHTTRNIDRHMERPKLMLVTEKHTADDRTKLAPRLEGLVKSKIIDKYGKGEHVTAQDVQDVAADFLTRILHHTKQQLIASKKLHFTDESAIEFVLTVPTVWHAVSSRVMQGALASAIERVHPSCLSHGSVNNLFTPAEPESAATYLMAMEASLFLGENFVMLDCGGGTVDGVAYTVTTSFPLRLDIEIGPPTGDNCGASYLNDNFEKRMLKRLADESYLDRNGETRESIVKGLIPQFENFDKRIKDITKHPSGKMSISGLIGDQKRGLTGTAARRFANNFILLNHEDYDGIFLPILDRVGAVLRTQLNVAFDQEKEVRKVFVIGGFAGAPSLRSYLTQFLEDLTRELNLPYDIEPVFSSPEDSVTAIASGSILRALNKEAGPTRHARSNYGFMRCEAYEPDYYESHKSTKVVRSPIDGQDYVKTIDYFMVLGNLISPVHQFGPFNAYQIFDIDSDTLMCEEIVYVNDYPTSSHYDIDHEMNENAQEAGTIITDMSFLLKGRDRSRIRSTISITDEHGLVHDKPYFKVEYDLVAIVDGRNLRYEARYPPGDSGRAKMTGQISIASAFLPGTG